MGYQTLARESLVNVEFFLLWYLMNTLFNNWLDLTKACLVKSSVDKTLHFWYFHSSPFIEHSHSSSASAENKYIHRFFIGTPLKRLYIYKKINPPPPPQKKKKIKRKKGNNYV